MTRPAYGRALLAIAALGMLSGCGSSGDQVWQFTLDREDGGTTTATAACRSDGNCDAGTWSLTEGCAAGVNFAVHFSGQTVSLDGFTLARGTAACGPALPRADSAGTGRTDQSFPAAQAAQGQVTLKFVGVFYVQGGPAPVPWHARRIS